MLGTSAVRPFSTMNSLPLSVLPELPRPPACLYRPNREWRRKALELAGAVKQLSVKECDWLVAIISDRPGWRLGDYKIPRSFFGHPVFLECAKKCVTAGNRKCKDPEAYFKERLMDLSS